MAVPTLTWAEFDAGKLVDADTLPPGLMMARHAESTRRRPLLVLRRGLPRVSPIKCPVRRTLGLHDEG